MIHIRYSNAQGKKENVPNALVSIYFSLWFVVVYLQIPRVPNAPINTKMSSILCGHVLESRCNAELFAIDAWTTWFRRNKVRTALPGLSLDEVHQRAIESQLEYRAAHPRKTPMPVRTRSRWSPPCWGSLQEKLRWCRVQGGR